MEKTTDKILLVIAALLLMFLFVFIIKGYKLDRKNPHVHLDPTLRNVCIDADCVKYTGNTATIYYKDKEITVPADSVYITNKSDCPYCNH